MSFDKTEAILLRAFNWSESSRTVVFFSREHGKLALIDKGGRSMKSRRGRLMSLAKIELSFYRSKKESRAYLREADLVDAMTMTEDGLLGRLAYGSAACELLYLLLPDEEPQTQLYSYFASFLGYVAAVPKTSLPALFVAFFLRVLSQLGYHPSLDYCSVCGKQAGKVDNDSTFVLIGEQVLFFAERGGLVCPTCQAPGDYYIPLSKDGFTRLAALQKASLKEAAAMPMKYGEANQVLSAIGPFLARQTGLKSDLKSLEFLEKLKNSALTE